MTGASEMYDAIAEKITTPDVVETRIGTLEFFDGLPTAETAAKAYDNLDFMRGVEAFLNGIHEDQPFDPNDRHRFAVRALRQGRKRRVPLRRPQLQVEHTRRRSGEGFLVDCRLRPADTLRTSDLAAVSRPQQREGRLCGSADGSVDLYFGHEVPEGSESSWIETIPGKGWFILLRLCGPLEPWFDKTWRPGGIQLIK